MADEPIRDWTPEEKRAIYDEMAARFKDDDFREYLEIQEPYDQYPTLDQVIEEFEEAIRQVENRKREAG